MNRGTVMELGSKNTVLLTPDGRFVNIPKEPHHRIGAETTFSAGSYYRIRRNWLASGLSAAALIILFLGLWNFRTPPVVAYVTMDINPSVELGLDAKERVRAVRAVNDDAEFILDGLEYRGRDLQSVMTEIAGKLVSRHLLTLTDGQIVIASVPMKSLDDSWETNVTYKMKQVLLHAAEQENAQAVKSLHITTVSLPSEVREEAEVNGVSSGKMAFWLIAESQGHELSIETLKSESLKNIAASWGGVDTIMSDHAQRKEDKDEWKRLLKDVKKNKKLPAKSERESPTATAGDAAVSQEPQQSHRPGAADKPKESDKPKHSGKWDDDKPGHSGKAGDSNKPGRSAESDDNQDIKEDKPQVRPSDHNDDDKQRADQRKKPGKVKKDDRNKNGKRGEDSLKNGDRHDQHEGREGDD
jgi:hypothetical protein